MGCSHWYSVSFPRDGRLCTTILRRRSESQLPAPCQGVTFSLALALSCLREVCRSPTPPPRCGSRPLIPVGLDSDWKTHSRARVRPELVEGAPAPHAPCLCPWPHSPDGRHLDSVRAGHGRSKTIPVAQSIPWRGRADPAGWRFSLCRCP